MKQRPKQSVLAPLIDPLDVLASQEDATSAIDAWLNVFARLIHLPEPVRQSIRSELREHLRERVRDLLLNGCDECAAVRTAIEELGETAQLARRFEAANRPNRRRMLMHATFIFAGVAALTAGVVTFTHNNANPNDNPNPAETPLPAVRFSRVLTEATVTQPKSLSEARITFDADTNLRDAVERLAATAKVGLTVDWGEIERAGVDYSQPMGLSVSEMTAAEALDRMARVGTEGEPLLDWRARDNGLEFGSKHELDKREVELVTYNIADTLTHIANGFAKSRDDAAEQIGELITSLADPENWRENGGELAQLHMVGGRLFVQAPKRMQGKVAWILDQLPKGEGEAAQAAAQRASVPILMDIPVLNRLFIGADLSELEQRAIDARNYFEGIKLKYAPGTTMYSRAQKDAETATVAFRSAQQAALANDPQAVREQYEKAKDEHHLARLKYRADSPEYIAIEQRLQAAEKAFTQAMHEALLLRPGDVLHIEVFELERPGEWFRAARQIEADGVVRFPMIGEFTAAGRAARDVEQDVIAKIKTTIIANPHVSVYQLDAATLRAMDEAAGMPKPNP